MGGKLLGLRRAKNPNYLMNFTETQKNVIVTNAFLNPSINSPIGRTVKEFFDEDDAKRSWGYNFAESPDLPTEFMDMFGVLQQSGFLVKQGNFIEVIPAYSPLVSVLVASEADPLSAADLKESQERQEKLGLEAE